MTSQEPQKFFISTDASIRDAIAYLGGGRKGIAFILDKDQRLVGTISDGCAPRDVGQRELGCRLAGDAGCEGVRAVFETDHGFHPDRPIAGRRLYSGEFPDHGVLAEYWIAQRLLEGAG